MSFARGMFRWCAMPEGSKRQDALDGLRGIAILLTFFVHLAGSYLFVYRGGTPDLIPFYQWSGVFNRVLFWLYSSHHGVSLFFILSGFLISRIVTKSSNFDYLRFIGRRAARIYPAFTLAVGLTLVVHAFYWKLPGPNLSDLLANFLFLNGMPGSGVPGILGNNVSWSLFYEMLFYSIFPLLMAAAGRNPKTLTFSIVAGGVIISFAPGMFGYSLDRLIFFFGGAVVGAMRPQAIRAAGERVPDGPLLLLYLFVTTAHTLGAVHTMQFNFLFALFGTLLLLKAASGEGPLARALSWPPLVWLGTISFSFYLLHSLAIGMAFAWAAQLWDVNGWIHPVGVGLLGFLWALVLSMVSFAIAERFHFKPSHDRVQPSHDRVSTSLAQPGAMAASSTCSQPRA